MRRTPASSPDTAVRIGLLGAGAAFFGSAAMAGRLAFEHMSVLGEICGASAPHCGWCAATVALAASGLASLVWAGRATAATVKVPA